jgi:hypothetical protein
VKAKVLHLQRWEELFAVTTGALQQHGDSNQRSGYTAGAHYISLLGLKI